MVVTKKKYNYTDNWDKLLFWLKSKAYTEEAKSICRFLIHESSTPFFLEYFAFSFNVGIAEIILQTLRHDYKFLNESNWSDKIEVLKSESCKKIHERNNVA